MTASTSYLDEWTELFDVDNGVTLLNNVRRQCFSGRLRGSKFRGICWRILLQCISSDKQQWIDDLRRWRHDYCELRTRMFMNPRECRVELDPELNNPLSLQSESPWQQYFADSDLRSSIHRDVERTFPELEYFQSPKTRKIMEDILFVYGREHPHIAYKQGMHEILGPLLFVLYCDQQAFAHAVEQDIFKSRPELQTVLAILDDEAYLENDAYAMFSQLMHILEPWYVSSDELTKRPSDCDASSAPFMRAQDTVATPTSALIVKLNWIGDHLLRETDAQLGKYLESLDIAPQIYGIRWLRLLFGREFPIQDLLFLWDAILADETPLVLVDFIFVAMLVNIRKLLLHSDYTACLQYLMRYPPAVDVHCFLGLALHLRNPQQFDKPNQYAFMNFSHITVAGRPHPNRDRETIRQQSPPKDAASGSNIGKNIEKSGRKVMTHINRMSNHVVESLRDEATISASASSSSIQPNADRLSRNRLVQSARTSPAVQRRPQLENQEMELMKEQVACLQTRLNEVDVVARMCADHINCCAATLMNSLNGVRPNAIEDVATELKTIADRLMRASVAELTIRNIPIISSDSISFGGDGTHSGTHSSPVEVARDACRAPEGLIVSSNPRTNSGRTNERRMTAISKLGTENELRELKLTGTNIQR